MELRHALLPTLAGHLLAVASPRGLCHLRILSAAHEAPAVLARLAAREASGPILREDPAGFKPLAEQLGEYFGGHRREFTVALDPHGTAFQLEVWRRIADIPFGKLRSYRELARELASPGAARAVGQAVAQNPLPILIPCHRVLGADGSLVGFGGGVDLKARLLRLEGHTLDGIRKIEPPRLF